MPKFFVCSDIHGFYEEFREALFKAGFDENNENHWLISCGDHFDRGPASPELMSYLMRLKRKILIRGNHEDLIEELMTRGTFYSHDISNGTVDTIRQFVKDDEKFMNDFSFACVITEAKTKKFLQSMVNYFETENYIFVHSWIPLIKEDSYPKYWTRESEFSFNPDWRNASKEEWEEAKWGNPFELAKKFLPPDKTIVFGHYHTSWAHCWLDGNGSEYGKTAKFNIYNGDKFIGIDACTAYSGAVNILVIEDNFIK
jgi:serine/threonine protein phosphatase 1